MSNKSLFKFRKYIFVLFFAIFCVTIYYLNNNVLVINNIMQNKSKIGIIDGAFHDNHFIVASNKKSKNLNKKTHGDALIDFLSIYAPHTQIFYFDASDDKNIITDDDIMNGLDWMYENGIYHVSISLSTKKYSKKLQDYINYNKDNFIIFASFNNHKNTFDYPAMYDNVRGIGMLNETNREYIYTKYKTNNIMIIGNEIRFFRGNSFLSLYEALNNSIN